MEMSERCFVEIHLDKQILSWLLQGIKSQAKSNAARRAGSAKGKNKSSSNLPSHLQIKASCSAQNISRSMLRSIAEHTMVPILKALEETWWKHFLARHRKDLGTY
jgi:hypothetical protein